MEETRRIGLQDRVTFTGSVQHQELAGIYQGASMFVMPSRLETFGIPLIEAMASGLPVVAANATAIPEVLGNGGETFTLDDTAELRTLLQRATRDAAFRHDLIDRAKARSLSFSWTRTAEHTVKVYRRAVSNA